jgi:hypothetical protein
MQYNFEQKSIMKITTVIDKYNIATKKTIMMDNVCTKLWE